MARLLLLLGIVLLPAANRAAADNIDDELIKRGPDLVAILKKQNLRHVGVLRFRVKKGVEDVAFNAGSMNTNMVTRIENLLVLSCDHKSPEVRVLDEPGQVIAGVKKGLSYLDAAGRSELFKLKYPVIGGGEEVSADAFLTGNVLLTPDYQITTLQVLLFTKDMAKPKTVIDFKVPTDRVILGDVGQSFAIKRVLKDDDVKDPIDLRSGDITKFVDFRIEYDDKVQEIAASTDIGRKSYKVAQPDENQKVVMKIKNITSKRLGVVLMVNGISTIFKQEGEFEKCRKWVLDPNEEYAILGYLMDADKMKTTPFKVVAATSELLSTVKAGTVELAVFEEAKPEPGAPKKISRSSLRGVMTPDLRMARSRPIEEYKEELIKSTRLKMTRTGFIAADTEQIIESPIQEVPFEGRRVAFRSIAYARAEK